MNLFWAEEVLPFRPCFQYLNVQKQELLCTGNFLLLWRRILLHFIRCCGTVKYWISAQKLRRWICFIQLKQHCFKKSNCWQWMWIVLPAQCSIGLLMKGVIRGKVKQILYGPPFSNAAANDINDKFLLFLKNYNQSFCHWQIPPPSFFLLPAALLSSRGLG